MKIKVTVSERGVEKSFEIGLSDMLMQTQREPMTAYALKTVENGIREILQERKDA